MGWNTDGTLLTAPVSVADVARACGMSGGDLGTLIAGGAINPMARYKPLRSSRPDILTDAARIAAGHGFPVLPSVNPRTVIGSPGPWVYAKPRGLNGGGSGVHEWFRMLDFIKTVAATAEGYAPNAAAPARVMLDGTIYTGAMTVITALFDEVVDYAYREEGSTLSWQDANNLGVADLLGSRYASNYYVAFIFADATDSDHPANVVVTDTSIIAAATAKRNFFMIDPQGYNDPATGYTYPAVPLLADGSRVGHSFVCAMCLVHVTSGWPITGQPYYVIPNAASMADCLSLAFLPDCERDVAVLAATPPSATGTVLISLTPTSTYVGQTGSRWRAWIISSVDLLVNTPGPAGSTINIDYDAEFNNGYPDMVYTGVDPLNQQTDQNTFIGTASAQGGAVGELIHVADSTIAGMRRVWLSEAFYHGLVEVTCRITPSTYSSVDLTPGVTTINFND